MDEPICDACGQETECGVFQGFIDNLVLCRPCCIWLAASWEAPAGSGPALVRPVDALARKLARANAERDAALRDVADLESELRERAERAEPFEEEWP